MPSYDTDDKAFENFLSQGTAEFIRESRRNPQPRTMIVRQNNYMNALCLILDLLRSGLFEIQGDEGIVVRPVSYQKYLQSCHWLETREKARQAAGFRCQVCNSSDSTLDVHHRTYEHIGHEKPDDLIVLCRGCHQLFHDNGKLAKPQE